MVAATAAEQWIGTGSTVTSDEYRKLAEGVQLLRRAYMEGPYVLPPEQLISQLKEQDSALLYDLVQSLYWEHIGGVGYARDTAGERNRAIDESRRLWKYNPLAQWMVWLWTNYGFGESIAVTPHDQRAVEIWNEFWKAARNQSLLAADKAADRLSNWLLVDGDRFLAFYASTLDGETTIRRINSKEITEIVTDPVDDATPLFYKRQWIESGGGGGSGGAGTPRTIYYPDWTAYFQGERVLGRAKLPRGAVRADHIRQWGADGPGLNTEAVILHVSFNSKDDSSLFGWPLLAAGSPWIRSQKRFMEDRLAVSASKAMYVRRTKVQGGSRAVDSVIASLQSALGSTQAIETRPPAVAGSTLVENPAADTTDFPMTTGAGDARIDHEGFAWMALLSGGVFPHWAGMGDAYRLATATAMEGPLLRQFSRYQSLWASQFRKAVQIVLRFKERFHPEFHRATPRPGLVDYRGGAEEVGLGFETYDAEVNIDKLVEVDLAGMSEALGRVFGFMINPLAESGAIPDEVLKGLLQSALRTILQALGVEPEQIIGDVVWGAAEPVTPTEPTGLEEATVLALQNYRDGSITADDIVALLAPTALEEGKERSGGEG